MKQFTEFDGYFAMSLADPLCDCNVQNMKGF